MKNLRLYAILAILLGVTSLARAADRVTCYTMWDDRYFYAAFEVQDPDLVSKNTAHMSNPWEDDAIEVFVETDAKRAESRTASTYQMSVSTGGGSSWLVGENGKATPKTIYTFKYAKKIQGTLNNSYDTDIGYTLEMAIPWKEMGFTPQPGQVIGFNFICRMKGEHEGFASLSPEVKTDPDIQVPAKWSRMKLVNTPTIIAVQDGILISRKVVNQPPMINGTMGPGEWMRDMRFQVVKPAPTKPTKQQFAMERLVLSPYDYDWKIDLSADADHPLQGAGPWASHDRVQWHKDQLAEMARTGIDVVLPVYQGNSAAKREFASKGLICMVQAMKELRAEGIGYPLVGMLFDTTAMNAQYGTNPDLKTDEVKATFYGMLKDYFLHVPDEFRAVVQTTEEKGADACYVVALSGAAPFAGMDDGFVEYCNKQFAQDFGGKLLWIGSLDARDKVKAVDGYAGYDVSAGIARDNTNGLDIASISPGSSSRPRMEGETFKKDWNTLVATPPHWVIINGWNNYREGSEIAPSAEYGERYPFLTKINLLRFNGMRPYDAKFLKHDTPTTMVPGAMYQVSLTVKNSGTKPWYAGLQGVFLTARWFKDGSLFADTSIRLPFQSTVLAGQMADKTVGIRTVDQDGKPLPEGNYELRWEMVRAHDEWFGTGGDTPLCVPVKISASPAPGFTVVSSTLPVLLKSGATYEAKLKVRNDGPVAWAAGTKIGYRVYKTSVHLGKDSEDSAQLLVSNEAAASLAAQVDPGRIAEIAVPVSMVGADGTPLPVPGQDDLSAYAVRWDVNDGSKWLAQPGVGCGSEVVRVTSDDLGAVFVSDDTPAEMDAGKDYKVNISLRNAGAEAWTKAASVVGYRWYYLDGAEAVADGKSTPLPKDVAPGQEIALKASVIAPPFDGQYLLAWDVKVGDKWASTSANTRGMKLPVIPVNVIKGRLVTVDLEKLYDTDVISMDANPKDGDADGAGLTLPAEFLPPLYTPVKNGKLWPSGIWTQANGLDSQKRISFKYPAKADGAKNALACKGQTIQVKGGKCSSVHVLVLPTQKATGASFSIGYGAAAASTQADFAACTEPTPGMQPAFVCAHTHSADGDQQGKMAYITDFVIQTDPQQNVTSITLPNNPALKVMAVTLEKVK